MVKLLICERVCVGVDVRMNYIDILIAFHAKFASDKDALDINLIPHGNEYALYVYADDREFVEYVPKDELLFKLCLAVEDVVNSKLCEVHSCYVIAHSGCIKVRNSNMLVIGQKESGKSTLISHLSAKSDFRYICDDATVLSINHCFGAQIPIRLRKPIVDGIRLCDETNKSSDGANERYLYLPINNPACERFKPSHILFPKYTNCGNPTVYRIDAINAFKRLVENSKGWSSPKDLYNIARIYASSIPAYVLRYDGIEHAHFMIERISSEGYEE